MQANINIKERDLSEKIKDFREKKYPHLSITKLFVHALVELMKKEG